MRVSIRRCLPWNSWCEHGAMLKLEWPLPTPDSVVVRVMARRVRRIDRSIDLSPPSWKRSQRNGPSNGRMMRRVEDRSLASLLETFSEDQQRSRADGRVKQRSRASADLMDPSRNPKLKAKASARYCHCGGDLGRLSSLWARTGGRREEWHPSRGGVRAPTRDREKQKATREMVASLAEKLGYIDESL